MVSRLRHPLGQVAIAGLLSAPWVAVRLLGVSTGTYATVAVTGLAVLGASFLLAWAAETAEKDVPRAFAIAVLAVLAVAPEYAVDALYAWGAGSGGATTAACSSTPAADALARACHDANLAVANMTGANRILIGIGWAGIAFYTVWQAVRTRDPAVQKRPGLLADVVTIDRGLATEIAFLFLATVFAFLVPLSGGIGLVDTVLLLGLYILYIGIIIRGDVDEAEEHVGVPAYFQAKARPIRVTVVLTLFAYSGLMIFTAVEPFAHGLEDIGIALGVPEFFMIQWIAPLASESPELIVVAVLVNKARSTAGFNALISSKLNQWTLLIGTLAIVYSIAAGGLGTLPFDTKQSAEIWITAAQSLFALSILINFEISMREALALFGLFISQVAIEFLVLRVFSVAHPEALSIDLLHGFTVLYLVLAFVLLYRRRHALTEVFTRARNAARAALGREPLAVEPAD
ncbi:sodium/calcium exchanger protein [Halapricum hydrolyticum]|uniref:Sodium:calcium antiporter n=1 Tax=Halapricum hydrolyticum TaxID=2979991 RepID=A0AAE3I9X8_9EURY|nr:sodium:calcium antiporter [Halapricum hydrolyticum]MCU4717219.1 sodium:calcium antiporter [Halapricum hydrolyticum]MCU4726146.1 sodium:calcium antiporter [Halapricum hydrolyticum]